VNGLGGGIDQEPSLSHGVDQPTNVLAHVSARVSLPEDADDVIE
jgi:hypothetical protein